jgi:hypothetical protein
MGVRAPTDPSTPRKSKHSRGWAPGFTKTARLSTARGRGLMIATPIACPWARCEERSFPRRLHTGVHRGALRQEPWGERDMMRTEVASGCGGGDKEMGSVQGGGIQAGWRALAGFRPATALGIGFVDLLDQAGPCGAAVLGRHRELGLRLVGGTDADGWLGWMIAFPTLGSEADTAT